MYVLCTLNVCIMSVLVCIDFDDMVYFSESNILTDVHMSMDSNSIRSHHSNRVFYFPRITQPIRDDLMARPWPTCWCRSVCCRILVHWLGHMCLPGSTRAACLPLKTEWFQCCRRVTAAGGPEYSWQALSTPGAQALARKASLSVSGTASSSSSLMVVNWYHTQHQPAARIRADLVVGAAKGHCKWLEWY